MRRFISLCVVVAATGIAALAATGAAGAAGGRLPKVVVTANGKSIHVRGALQSGGVNVVTNVNEPRANPIFIRLNAGVAPHRLISFLRSKAASDANAIDRFGSIRFDADVSKGKSSVQTKLEPGKYVALDASRGPSKAPTATFTVEKASQPAPLPKPAATVRTIEFRFRGAAKLHAGSLVRFKNSGFLAHMDIALPTTGRKGKRLVKVLRAGRDGAARKLVTGQPLTWLGTVSHGAVQQMRLNAKPGAYVMACFEDTQDGREHTQLGMERLVHVVK